MENFLKDNWPEILSIIGAAAWLPIVFVPLINAIINHFRKLQATVLDARVLTDGKGISVGKKSIKTGTILLFVSNLFIKKTTIFAKNISIKVKLNNGAQLTTEMLDFSTITSNNDDNTRTVFHVPVDREFNISRTIHPNVDNIKYLAVLVENADFSNVDDISEIEITLYYSGIKCDLFSKKVLINKSDFPMFNSSHLIDMVEKLDR